MERAEFEALVSRMESLARQRPLTYRRRVFGLAALGYGYLTVVVLVLLALTGLAVLSVAYLKFLGVKLVVLSGALLLAVLRSLWVKQEHPQGEPLAPKDAPQLFELLAELERQLETPTVHSVLITADFNAAVSQLPRLGFFGWHRNYLLLGLPLMKALTVPQFKSVLAHELGHLSRGHARAANWIYRLRLIWVRLEATFERRPLWGSGLVRGFFKWYIPYFNAVSFPLARANEYEADAAAVKLAGARATAQALTGVHMFGNYLAKSYWPNIHAAAKESAQPAFAPYSGFVAEAVRELPESELARWQESALGEATSHADTHPALADRLRAMGAAAEFAPPTPAAGADQLLGAARRQLEHTFDTKWRERVAESWRKFHAQTQTKRARLAELRTEREQQTLSDAALLELAGLEEEVGDGIAAALVLLRAVVAKSPTPAAQFALAGNLLRQDQDEGVALMEATVGDDPAAVFAGGQLLRDYHKRRGEHAAARVWQERAAEAALLLQKSRRERQRLLLSDRYVAHALDADSVLALRAQLQAVKGVKRAFFVRKLDPHLPNLPLFVLGLKTTGFFQLHNRQHAADVTQAVKQQVKFPGETLIIVTDGNLYKFARKLRRVKGARIV